MGGHTLVECILPGVSKWRVTKIMGERNRFGKVIVKAECARNGAGYLRNLNTVRQTRTEQIPFVVNENLGLVFQPPEGR
jgi:hypothetical protein